MLFDELHSGDKPFQLRRVRLRKLGRYETKHLWRKHQRAGCLELIVQDRLYEVLP